MPRRQGWRSLTPKDREGILLDISMLTRSRFGPGSIGHQQYGEIFDGDPLEQAIQEQVDSLFYLLMELRRRKRHGS